MPAAIATSRGPAQTLCSAVPIKQEHSRERRDYRRLGRGSDVRRYPLPLTKGSILRASRELDKSLAFAYFRPASDATGTALSSGIG